VKTVLGAARAKMAGEEMRRVIHPGRNTWTEAAADASGPSRRCGRLLAYLLLGGATSPPLLLMSGWQFDSGVPLLRGADVIAGMRGGRHRCPGNSAYEESAERAATV